MLTIGNIYHIIGGELKDAHNSKSNEINDFETKYKFVKNKKTAYFSLFNCQIKCNTLSLKSSAGVFQSNRLRGRVFNL